MRVVGIDLSLASTGLAAIEGGTLVSTYAYKTQPAKTLDGTIHRLQDVAGYVRDYVDDFDPDLVVIEAPSFASSFGNPHERAGLWWMVVRDIWLWEIPIARVSPMQRAKYGTGKGNSKKKDVHAEVKVRYGSSALPIKTNDEADAVILAAMGSRHLGKPVESFLPDSYLAAMEKVMWS